MIIPKHYEINTYTYLKKKLAQVNKFSRLCKAMCAVVYIYRDIVAERREEMLQGRFLPGGLSMQKKATMLQTTVPEIYPNKTIRFSYFVHCLGKQD